MTRLSIPAAGRQGKVKIHIAPQDTNIFYEQAKDHAKRVVQILDAHNARADQIESKRRIAVCVGILGALIAAAFLAGL